MMIHEAIKAVGLFFSFVSVVVGGCLIEKHPELRTLAIFVLLVAVFQGVLFGLLLAPRDD